MRSTLCGPWALASQAILISGQPELLSIHEVALLAGMKEKSVRNLAHKEIGAVFNPDTGQTHITADNAFAWLKERRKFTPTQPIQTEAARQKLVELYEEFF